MSKFHINKHGVPAPCRATKGNCPLGGDSGNENHYDTEQEAQAGADKINETKHSILPGVREVDRHEEYSYEEEQLSNMNGKQIYVEYDGKSFAGEVIGTHYAGDDNDMNGIIIQDSEGNVKHIKSHRLTGVEIEDDEAEEKMSDEDVVETGKRLTSQISRRNNSVERPNIPEGSIRSIDDVDTLIETRGQFVTSDEHNPVENAKSMFDHVANKSGKLDRYNDSDNPYLETHGYDFEKSVSNHKSNLESDGTFDDYDEDNYFTEEHGKTSREAFADDVQKHRELNDYSRDVAVEYGKDYERKVVMSGNYNREEQEKLKGEYRKAVADKIGSYVQNYGDDE